MSDYFEMSFCRATSEGQAMIIARRYVEKLKQHAKEILENNEFYLPSRRYPWLTKESDQYFSDILSRADEYWLFVLFSPHFVFWPEYKLVGVSGSWPVSFGKKVVFQDNGDQNYDFEEWPHLKFFKETIRKIKEMPVDQIMENMKENGFDLDDYAESEEYCRKTITYKEIYRKLGLYDWLYDREAPKSEKDGSPKFIRFSVCSFTSYDELAKTYYKYLHTKSS